MPTGNMRQGGAGSQAQNASGEDRGKLAKVMITSKAIESVIDVHIKFHLNRSNVAAVNWRSRIGPIWPAQTHGIFP